MQALFDASVARWRRSGVRVAGVIEEPHGLPGRPCSAGFLRDIASGARYSIHLPMPPRRTSCHIDAAGAQRAGAALIGGREPRAFDPERPGIAGVSRHPLLLAIVLWAGSHIVPNGDLAHLLLFGTFALAGCLGMVAIDRRTRRSVGPEQWHRLAARTSLMPCAALFSGRWHPNLRRLSWARVALAALLYVSLLAFHQPVMGVAPWPAL